ncbi:MAG: PilZ domain-containing protein [Parvularculaceae bacterium]|nr:PilZ domain-containing protein [Parvularculaceae bacterium]
MGSQNKPSLTDINERAEPESADLLQIDERRASVRRPTFKAAEILASDGKSFSCVVRNISESGCLMKLDNADLLPDLIEIRIDLDKPARAAEVVWRSATLAGAMFVRKPS